MHCSYSTIHCRNIPFKLLRASSAKSPRKGGNICLFSSQTWYSNLCLRQITALRSYLNCMHTLFNIFGLKRGIFHKQDSHTDAVPFCVCSPSQSAWTMRPCTWCPSPATANKSVPLPSATKPLGTLAFQEPGSTSVFSILVVGPYSASSFLSCYHDHGEKLSK